MKSILCDASTKAKRIFEIELEIDWNCVMVNIRESLTRESISRRNLKFQ